jgi:integrase/recombinase XerC
MSAITLDSIQPFFDYLKFEKRYSVHTLTSYETDLKDFIDFLSVNYPGLSARDITHTYIRSWLADLKGRGLESTSINRKISSLRSLYKFFLKMGVVDNSPMSKVNNLKTGRKLPVFVREQEAADLMQSLRFHIEDWRSLNASMLITIFYSTGMRLSELVNLKEKQLDLDRKQIKVLGKGNKERIIPVSGEMVAMIRDYMQQKREEFAEGPVIDAADAFLLVTEKGKKLYPKYAWNIVNAQLGQATSLDKKSPHVLRHSFATHLMNNGADLNAVKELLGHSSLAATQVYTHNTIEKLREIHKKAHPKG